MASQNVTNKSQSALGLPNGPVIQPGATAQVENFEAMDSNPVVKSWIEAGALVLGDEGDADAAGDNPSGDAALAVTGDHNRIDATTIAQTSGLAPIGATAEETGTQDAKPWNAADEGENKAEAEAASAPKKSNKK